VKGLEGSCDLPRSRTAIVGMAQPDGELERLLLHAPDYGFTSEDPPLEDEAGYLADITAVLAGKPGSLTDSAIWNGGFYLWRFGVCPSIAAGIEQARATIMTGKLEAQVEKIQAAIQAFQQVPVS
jgi:anthranilate phosphoribosyltransferase